MGVRTKIDWVYSESLEDALAALREVYGNPIVHAYVKDGPAGGNHEFDLEWEGDELPERVQNEWYLDKRGEPV